MGLEFPVTGLGMKRVTPEWSPRIVVFPMDVMGEAEVVSFVLMEEECRMGGQWSSLGANHPI